MRWYQWVGVGIFLGIMVIRWVQGWRAADRVIARWKATRPRREE